VRHQTRGARKTSGLCAGEASCGGGDDAPLLTRRRLLITGVTAAVAVTLPPVTTTAEAIGRQSWLRRGSYAQRVGETFEAVLHDGATVALRLAGVADLVGTSPRGNSLARSDDSFLLEFDGPISPQFGQGVYELRHVAFGRDVLFLVPHAPRSNDARYAVVVNRHDT
jgi:uncharacterized protein DUF6916